MILSRSLDDNTDSNIVKQYSHVRLHAVMYCCILFCTVIIVQYITILLFNFVMYCLVLFGIVTYISTIK
jgi:hypothetical protein